MRSERGITIIETTVILSVLFILAGAMSPIVSESVTTARAVKAKNDASMIAIALINLQNDLGVNALTSSGADAFGAAAFGAALQSAPAISLPEVLSSAGLNPEVEDSDPQETPGALSVLLQSAGAGAKGPGGASGTDRGNRRAQRRKWRESGTESIDDHLTTNRRGYQYRRPGENRGWNGPYLSARIKGDPWGKQYLVNAKWLDGGSTAADAEGRPRRAVFVLSAGANGVIETPYEQSITEASTVGDDVAVRIQ